MFDAGVDIGHITFTSDGQGSLPAFDAQGRLQRLEVGRVTSLFAEVRDAVFCEGLPLEDALRVITSNPARIPRLRGKGELVPVRTHSISSCSSRRRWRFGAFSQAGAGSCGMESVGEGNVRVMG